jgi:hypothetical protein
MWDYAHLLDTENFERLCSKLLLRTTKHAHIAVGTSKSHLVYESVAPHPDWRLVQAAHEWLGVSYGPDWTT